MKLYQLDTSIRQLFTGQILLAVCCVFYLVWWGMTFRPGRHGSTLAGGITLGLAALCGILGIVFSVRGIRMIPERRNSISVGYILAAGAIIYMILLAITWFGLKRQVTTELFLIVGWSVLELCVLSSAYGGEIFSMQAVIAWSIIIAVAAIVSLICYLLYYQMPDLAGYIDGMIPLILIGVVAAGIGVHLYLT